MTTPEPGVPPINKGISADGEILLVTSILCTLLSLAFVILRIFERLREFRVLHVDDYTIIISWVLCLGTGVLTSIWVFYGGVGWPIKLVPPLQIITFFKYFYALELLYSVSIAVMKVSILFLYMRIFDTPKFKIAARTLFAILVLWLIASGSSIIWQCKPIQAAWEIDIPATCLNKQSQFWANGILSLLLDVAILCLPVPMIWGLQMTWQKKVAIIAVFLTGSLVCISSILRLTAVGVIKNSDFTLTISRTARWSIAEINVAVIAACLPKFGHLFTRWKRRAARTTPHVDPERHGLNITGRAMGSAPSQSPRKAFDPYSTDVGSKRALSTKMSGCQTAGNEAYNELESVANSPVEEERMTTSDEGRRKREPYAISSGLAPEIDMDRNVIVTTHVTVSQGVVHAE